MNTKNLSYVKGFIIGLAGVCIVLVFILVIFFMPEKQVSLDVEEEAVSLETLITASETDHLKGGSDSDDIQEVQLESRMVVVDVKGAVKSPGVYSLTTRERIIDAINAAGGLSDNAEVKHTNFAQLLVDEMFLYIPTIGEEITEMDLSSGGSSSETVKINLNTADENDLLQLNGIGPSKAAEIIKYREENGPFTTINDITEVSGIGDKTFERIQELIEVK